MAHSHNLFAITLSACALLIYCQSGIAQQGDRPNATAASPAEHAIYEQALRGHIRFLASDLLEGRGPGSRGDDLAQQYIAAQFESYGLKPAAAEVSWFQRVPLVGVTAQIPAAV